MWKFFLTANDILISYRLSNFDKSENVIYDLYVSSLYDKTLNEPIFRKRIFKFINYRKLINTKEF